MKAIWCENVQFGKFMCFFRLRHCLCSIVSLLGNPVYFNMLCLEDADQEGAKNLPSHRINSCVIAKVIWLKTYHLWKMLPITTSTAREDPIQRRPSPATFLTHLAYSFGPFLATGKSL